MAAQSVGSLYTNALVHEKSPYLLQHAHNPVNWYAWGDEAFSRAEREDKPIFLSIGYATCHWCHVMERESFENVETAAILNEHYIAIKVDREERPDIDAIYMAACQAMTGHGGWPLSVFMTPDKKPFFVGTYFPPRNYANRPGFPYILDQIRLAWHNDREKVKKAGSEITKQLSRHVYPTNGEMPTLPPNILEQAFTRYEQSFDAQFGGFGSQPKFPSPQNLLFLLRYFKRTGNNAALVMVERTLQAMRKGGVYDHIGFGFHRYSTDRYWLLPHFEKMLYDQAMIALACIETFQVTQNALYSSIAEEIFTYVLRDMTAPEGGFYSAEDADSEGHEGKFYVWTHEELVQHLGSDDAALFCTAYNIQPDGNFADESTGTQTGENIPHMRLSIEETAQKLGMDAAELRMRLSIMRSTLFDIRERRVHPLKDDKVLADWNGLMIAAFAVGGKVLENAVYIQAAERAFAFIQQTMTTSTATNGERLLHRWRDGEAAIRGFLDDYAFVAWGAFELYQATFKVEYLQAAIRLCDTVLEAFAAPEGGFYLTAHDNETLIIRSKEGYDGAIPSGNSVAAFVLARLGKLTSNEQYLQAARRTIESFARQIQAYPTGFAQMLVAHDFLRGTTQEIVLAGTAHDQTLTQMIRAVAETYLPHAVLALNTTHNHELKTLVEQAQYQTPINGTSTAYICENFACQSPLTDAVALLAALAAL